MGCSSSSQITQSSQVEKLLRAFESDDPSALLAGLQLQRDSMWRHATLTLCLRRLGAPAGIIELVCEQLPRYSPPELDLRIECDGSPAVHGTEDHYKLFSATIAIVRPAASGPLHYSEQMKATHPGYGWLCGCIIRHLYWLPELAWGVSGYRSPKILRFLEGAIASGLIVTATESICDAARALGAAQLATWFERRRELCRAHYLRWGELCPAGMRAEDDASAMDRIHHWEETHQSEGVYKYKYNLGDGEAAVYPPSRGQEARSWGLYHEEDWLPDWMLDSVALKAIADAKLQRLAC